jgi:hypothetical protein
VLVTEEMRRTFAFLMHKSDWWLSLDVPVDQDRNVTSGARAYFQRQSLMYRALACDFRAKWIPILSLNGLMKQAHVYETFFSKEEPTVLGGETGIGDYSDEDADSECGDQNITYDSDC